MKIKTLVIFSLFLASCHFDKGNIVIHLKKESIKEKKIFTLAHIEIINNQFVLTGMNLNDVTSVKIKEGSTVTELTVESISTSRIVANTLSNVSFAAGRVFDFILSDAKGASTFTVNFSLCDSSLNGVGFNCSISAQDKDVLSYDATTNKWLPRNVNGLNYKGTFSALLGTDPGGSPASGDYYIITTAGTINSIAYAIGDWISYSGDEWQKIANARTVLSVYGRTGNISARKGDYNLNKLGDVDLSIAPVAGKVLKFDGTNWIAGDDISGGAVTINTSNIVDAAVTDVKINSVTASKITGTITSTQILDGTILNADINAAAAIDYSKLNIPNGSIVYSKLSIADGDIPLAKVSGLATSLSAMIEDTISDAVTTKAPSENAVFDALATKINKTGGTLSIGTIDGVPTPVNPSEVTNKSYVDTQNTTLSNAKVSKSGDTMSGLLTLDADLKLKGGANYVTLKSHAATATYNFILPSSGGTSGYVLSTDGLGNTSWINSSVASSNIVDGTIVDADVSPTAAIAESKIANLTTDLTAINTNLTTLNGKGQWNKVASDVVYSAGDVEVDNNLKFKDGATNYVSLKAPATVTTTYSLTLPPAKATVAGQALTSDTSGVLSWSAITDASVLAFARSALPTCNAGEVLKSNGTSFSCVTDNTGSGAFSGAINRAIVSDGAGSLGVSATTSAEVGYLSGVTSAIQTQLNTKASTTLPTTNILVGDGSNIATAVAMSGDATLSNTGALTLKNTGTAGTYISVTTDAQGRVTAGTSGTAVASITGTAPVTVAGTATVPVISMAAATTAVDGYLKASDWTIFNAKQAALSTGPTINGIVYPTTAAATLQIPLAPVALTDAVNKQYVDSLTGGQWTVSGSDVYRTTGNVGIGTTNPTSNLHVKAAVGNTVSQMLSNSDFVFGSAGSAIEIYSGAPAGNTFGIIQVDNSGGAGFGKLNLNPWGGNVGIGTTAPGSSLDVKGTLRLSGATSGYVGFVPAAVAGATTYLLPASQGSAGQVLSTDGVATTPTLSWITPASSPVTSVNTLTGAVVLTTTNVAEGTNLYSTNARTIASTLTGFSTGANSTILAADTILGGLQKVQGQLDAKESAITAGTTAQYIRGNKTLSTFASDIWATVLTGLSTATNSAIAATDTILVAFGKLQAQVSGHTTSIANKADTTNTLQTITALAVTGLGTPIAASDAANKSYVDNLLQWTIAGSDIYRATGNVGIGVAAPGSKLDIAAGVITTNTPIISGTETWNAVGTTFSAATINVTDTASAASSKLLDLKVAGVSKFSVDKTGKVVGDGSGLTGLTGVTGTPAEPNVAFLTSGTSWTTTAAVTATTMFKITVIGAGGGGGGAKYGASWTSSAGGGAGGIAIWWVSGLSASTAYTYAIGAAGTAGAVTPTNGGNGGNSSITINGTTVTGGGGTGGTGNNNGSAAVAGGAGGTVTGGTIPMVGQAGKSSYNTVGNGGSGQYGMGGPAPASGSGQNTAGNPATGFGAGGSGAMAGSNPNAYVGGAGSPGAILIEWQQ